jgi:hypothetical protein
MQSKIADIAPPNYGHPNDPFWGQVYNVYILGTRSVMRDSRCEMQAWKELIFDS